MRKLRVRRENAVPFSLSLLEAGFKACPCDNPHTTLNDGCSDPEHCEQHDSFDHPENWSGVLTNASGTQAHAVWKEAGLVT